MKNSLNKIFKKNKNIIIGAIHFSPLFGYKDYPGLNTVLKNSTKDLEAFEKGMTDGIIIENNYDIPHKITVNKETTRMMIYLGKNIKRIANIPIGVSVLWNDYKSALSIAKIIDAKFIRIPVFVDKVKTDYGEIFGNPKDVLNYRKKTKAENIALFTDIHVKHANLLEKNTVETSALKAIKYCSDALIITGEWTGKAPNLKELKSVRKAVGNFPILIGSGVDVNNIKDLFKYANGAIVSTSLKEGWKNEKEINTKSWNKRINAKKVRILTNLISKDKK